MSMITYIYTIYNIETICRDIHIFCLPVDSWWNCLNFFFNILVHLTHCKVTRVCVCVFVYSNNTPYNICVLDLCKIFRNIILCTQVVTNKTSNVSHCQNYLTALRNKIQKTKKKNHLLYTWLLFCPELGLIYLNWSKCLFTLFCDAVMHELQHTLFCTAAHCTTAARPFWISPNAGEIAPALFFFNTMWVVVHCSTGALICGGGPFKMAVLQVAIGSYAFKPNRIFSFVSAKYILARFIPVRPCGPWFKEAWEPIHLNGLPCPATRRKEAPALFWKSQSARVLFPVRWINGTHPQVPHFSLWVVAATSICVGLAAGPTAQMWTKPSTQVHQTKGPDFFFRKQPQPE